MDAKTVFPLREFSVSLHSLSKRDIAVVKKLTEAVSLSANLFLKQENRKFPGANFYPHDASKEEIEAVAQSNPAILSPYTVVERNDKGELVAIPYHIKYNNELSVICEKLREAASLTDNKEFAKRLEFQADALVDGTYEASDIYWLTMEPYKIEIVIGPINEYDDRLFFKKLSYEGWVGIMDEDATKEALQFKELFASAKRKTHIFWEKVEMWDKLHIRVDDTILYAGFGARTLFTGYNLPGDPRLIEKYGSEITFFKPALDIKFETRHYNIFKHLFHPEFQKSFTKEELRKADLQNIVVHELGHPFLRYRDAEERLKELYPVFNEIAASIIGIKNAGTLVLKDFISQKELEAILIMFLCMALDWEEEVSKTLPNVEPFVRGNAIALNYFFQSGALQEAGGISWPNFTKMFVALDELTEVLERYLAEGSYEDAQKFVDKFGNTKVFEKFNVRLNGMFNKEQVKH